MNHKTAGVKPCPFQAASGLEFSGVSSINGSAMTDHWKSRYPFASHHLDLQGLRYHYLDEGSGSPLVMVHGNPTWSFYWRNLVTAFRPQFRVVVPDHMGCGLSDKPQDYPYCLDQHIDNLTQLVERLDLRGLTLLAHDWGGAIGLGMALRVPERVARLVLFNTGAFPPPSIPWRIRVCRTPGLGPLAVRGGNLFARAALTMAVEHGERMTPPVRAGLLAPYDSWAHRIAILRFVQDIPTSPRHRTWQTLAELERGLPSLADRPCLLVWGMRDWCFTPRCLERFQSLLPSAGVRRIEDAGHYVIEDAHERIVPWVTEFLDENPVRDE